MRIAIVVHQFPAMSQTFILSQITTLIDSGHCVDIYANTPGTDHCVPPDVREYDLLKHTFYWRRPRVNRGWQVFVGLGVFIRNLRRNPRLPLLALRALKYKNLLPWSVLYYSMVRIRPKACVYDVIHCHFGPNGLKAAILRDLGALQGKLFTTFHGYDMTSYLRSHGERAYDFLFDKGDCFLPISEHWKNKLVRLGCDESRIFVHRMGIPVKRFKYLVRNRNENEHVRLVSIARLVEKKGLEYEIRALAELSKTCPRISCEIIGDGPLRMELQSLIESLGLIHVVKLTGWKNQDEIVQMLKRAHILVAPSVTATNGDQEGVPVVLMEAMAMGLPVVSTWHSGIPELVQHRVTGYLVPEGDVSALRDTLELLCRRPQLCGALGRAGREHVEAHHDLYKQTRELVKLYCEDGVGCEKN